MRGDHRIALFERGGHRLFAQHMFSGVQRFNADACVYVRRRADIDHIDLNACVKHRLMAAEDLRFAQAIA
ncbi:hypothetical protein SDC9_163461 [bioreactor metagenome]|uniref:Uncharacterized protein n=1 Tax=bioreactor metagenome TaxID=1076179 RepID=A0A645FVM0_9ZZZZ